MVTKRDLRSWALLVFLLLIGIICMLVVGQFAISMAASQQIDADMGSNIDPNAEYAVIAQTRAAVYAPVGQGILTPFPWQNIYWTATPYGQATATPAPATPTLRPTATATVNPTATRTPVAPSASPTRSPTPTSTLYVPPLPTATFTPVPGSITIVLNSLPNDAQDFPFSSPSLGAFNLDDDSDPALANSRTFTGLAAGSYTVTQALVAGWDLTTLVCNDPDGGTLTNPGSRTATIDLDAGEAITCTFTDARRGTVTIIKDSLPNDPQDFAFNSPTLGSFNLDDDSDPALADSRTFTGLAVGTYVVSEPAVPGWDLTGLSCVDPSGNTTVAGNAATIRLDPAEAITCTFTNTKRGTIVIVKDALPDNAQDFAFTRSFGAGFSLDDDADATLPNTATFANLLPGSYTVSEGAAAGWFLTGLNCADPDGGSSGDTGTRTATIDLDAGEAVTCTFVNTQAGTVTIYQVGQPFGDAQTFGFTGTLGTYTLDDNADPTYSNAAVFTGLLPGSYNATQAAVAGWDLMTLTCLDPDFGSTVNLGTRTATIDFDPGETITCTFTNAKRGTIIIQKDTNGGNDTFTFARSFGPDFPLTTVGGTASQTFSNLSYGTYTVTEGSLSGWSLTDVTCTDPDSGSSGDTGTRTATIDLDPGETVTCTYTNDRQASITVIKDSMPNDAQVFNFTGSGPGGYTFGGGFPLYDDGSGIGNSRTFSGLNPGNYDVYETPISGWDLTTPVICDNGDANTNIHLNPGENVTCLFTNTRRATLTIVKDSRPDDGQDFAFTGSGAIGSFNLDDDADPTLSNTAIFSLMPGTYSVSEGAVAGWDLTGTSCTDLSPVSAIVLSAGENTTCTFVNSRRGTITIVENSQPDGPQDFAYTGSGAIGSFTLDDDLDPTYLNTQTFSNLPVGTFTVSQAFVSAWNTNISCSDGSSVDSITRTATIVLDPAETVTCTFTNSTYADINIGPGDGFYEDLIPEGSTWITYLPTPIQSDGNTSSWDLVYYEMFNLPCWSSYGAPICLDVIRIDISPDGVTWTTVFYYGGGVISNTSIAGYPEADNTPILPANLILSPLMTFPNQTGIGIDIDARGLSGSFYYLRIYSPLTPPSTGDGCEVDSVDPNP